MKPIDPDLSPPHTQTVAAPAPTPIQEAIPLPKKRSFFGFLGPGLITGAADDDPSGIATYSQAGAQFGQGATEGWSRSRACAKSRFTVGGCAGRRDSAPCRGRAPIQTLREPGRCRKGGGEAERCWITSRPATFWFNARRSLAHANLPAVPIRAEVSLATCRAAAVFNGAGLSTQVGSNDA